MTKNVGLIVFWHTSLTIFHMLCVGQLSIMRTMVAAHEVILWTMNEV